MSREKQRQREEGKHKDGAHYSSFLESTQKAPKCISNQMPVPQADAPRQADEVFPHNIWAPLHPLLPCWPLGQVSLRALAF